MTAVRQAFAVGVTYLIEARSRRTSGLTALSTPASTEEAQ